MGNAFGIGLRLGPLPACCVHNTLLSGGGAVMAVAVACFGWERMDVLVLTRCFVPRARWACR